MPTRNLPREEFVALVRHARQRNEADGITGVLIFDNENLMQILEGEDDKVDACFDRIKRDTRHTDVITINRMEIPDRAFRTWRMGSLFYGDNDQASRGV